MGSNCCKGDVSRPIRSTSSIYSRYILLVILVAQESLSVPWILRTLSSRAGAALDARFTAAEDARGGGARLALSAAAVGDSGLYTLQASNAAGSDTSTIRLEVAAEEAPTGEDPPAFLRRLQDLTVKVGSRTRFLVEIISSTECKVTWYRNERRLLEAERVALARDGNFWCADVAAVSVDDAGRWTCTAENAGGRASCSAHLNVLVPKAYKRPEFVEELQALLTEQGTVSLECKVVGVPTPVLRWFKDSREIKAGDVFALTANAEDPTSLGTYTCEAVNCMGRAYSSSKVHVVGRASREGSSSGVAPEPPPIFTKELEDAHVKICDHLTLGCHIVVPPWPRSVVWYNKEGKVEPGERYQVLEDGVGGYLLEVASAEWADEGEWKCVATSAGGRVGISTCYVAMDVPKNYRKPRFMENLQAVLTEEGLVSFECKVVGFPTPVLSWFKDGQELKPGDVYQLTGTNSLGSYCCIARNCMGQASSSAELTVEDIQNQLNEEEKLQLFSKNQAPKFIQGLKSVEAKIDEPFRFTIKVAIPPEPSVLWYRDDQPVDESTRCHLEKEDKGVFNLDIQNLEFLDQAEWKCVAMNDFGHSVTSCFLKLIIPRHYKKPRFLENLQAILSDEGAVNLECKVIGVPQPVLKWYKDGEELKPGDIHRIISGQDGTCCLGTYTCEAQNCMGIAASSASLLGFDDSIKTKSKKTEELPLQRQLSLSTIHEERTSQMYDTPVGDITIDDKGEISFSFDGKEVSVSLYETPDLTEEEALQIVEMYADQLSENVTEHNVVELPPLRFVKETSTSGNLLMEAIIIDVSPDYFAVPEEDLRTEADVEDLSIADENGPPMLSLDQDIDLGGEDYLENTIALLSDEKSDLPAKSSRKKSDSQRSGDDFFSLSRDQSLSEEKRDEDTNISESDLQSFASARSSAKLKSKSSKPSAEEGQESSEPTKTILLKDDLKSSNEKLIKGSENELEVPVVKPKRERRSSRGSRRSSTSSEKSISKSREELLRIKREVEQSPMKPLLNDDDLKFIMNNISTSLTKVINDVQLIERDIILKSELMSSAATASRSLEIISSLIAPLSEIHSIADATTESMSESREVTSTIFNSIPKPLKSLQQSLTIIEKCIDVESDNKTLVKKTCVSFIESCGSEVQKIISDIASIASKGYFKTEDKFKNEIESVTNEITSVIKFSVDTIQARSLLTQASEIKPEEPTSEIKHLRDTQKAVFELKSPLHSLLRIVESAESGKTTDLATIKNSEVIMNDMSASIQGLQTALEQIESLSVKETSSTLQMYNTEIIETVMDSVLKLRESFEQLSTETKTEEGHIVLKETLASLKENLTEISRQIETVDDNVGLFDVLQSDNKLDVLQKMAQILIALENNLSRLETIPDAKSHMDTFHKNLTKVLEKVIESNDANKYLTMMEICDTVNILNSSIKNLDADNVLPLASICNSLKIIQTYFVTNVFESGLNCSIMNNISDILVGIHKAINKAEEKSLQVDSEYIQEFSTHTIGEEIVNIILEHIDKTIAAVDIIKTIESTKELQSALAPILENISPVLEELRQSVGSIRSSGVEQEEHVSEMSDKSFAQTIASPLCELNQNLIVLNQFIVENLDMIKEYSEVVTAIAEPLHELHTTLEILQQDVISQYRDDLTPYEVSVNMASVVQNLQSCIVMIQEQTGVEAAEEMSTLEDISGIKTSADTLPSDRLVLPTAEETTIEQSLPPLIQEIATTATALTLQTLNEHIMVLQTPEVIETLDILSQVSDYSSLKTIAVGLEDLHTGLEGILHPVPIEGSIDLEDISNISGLAAIAEPMQDLHQSLSILDTSNIPVYENFLDLPADKIHSVIQNISEFKSCLEQCIGAVFPAMEIATNTIEISSKVSSLREVCEQLREIFETSKYAPAEMALSPEVHNLELVVESLIDATDASKNIKIEQVKCIAEELYLKVKEVQEDLIQFTAQAPEKLSQEAKLIQIVCDVETNIAVLEQYDFIDLTRASDITACASPQLAVEIDSESLVQIHDIAEHAVNVLQDYYQEIPLADLMIVEDFFKRCKNEFTILRCLITKATTHKKIIRLLQEFSSLQTMVNNFTTKRLELHLSDDVNECLTDFLIHADECLRNVRTSLIKVIDSQTVLLINAPIAELESIQEFKNLNEANSAIAAVVKYLLVAAKSSKSLTNTLLHAIMAELLNPNQVISLNEDEISLCANMEEIAMVIETQLNSGNNDETTQNVLQRLIECIHKHHDYKDAIGKGKILIILKCLADCVNIVQNTVVDTNILKNEETKNKLEKNSINEVLAEMIQPLEALQTQLVNIREQVLSGAEEDTISIDITSTESIMQYMTELHKDIVQQIDSEEVTVDNESISIIKEVDKEIHTIQESIKSMENIDAAQAVQEITKPMEEIGNSLHDVLSSEKHTLQKGTLSKEKAANLLHHIDQYIGLKEMAQEIATIIKVEDVNETFDIARQLRENIGIIEGNLDNEQTQENIVTAREEQGKLAKTLQNALSGLQVLVLENTQDLASLLKTDAWQKIDKVTAQLKDNLVALTGVQTIVQPPAPYIKSSTSERSTELSISSELIGANTIESINTEQCVATNINVPLEDVLITTEIPQNAQEADIVQPAKYIQPAEETSKLTTQTEKCEEFSIECVQDLPIKTDLSVKDIDESSISFTDSHEAVVTIEKEILEGISQIPSLDHVMTEQLTESIIKKSDHLGEAERLDKDKDITVKKQIEKKEVILTAQGDLMRHINEYVSDDIIEVVNQLSSIMNCEELKQSVNIAKELRESITSLESNTNEVIISGSFNLLFSLENALSVLSEQTLESLHELIPSVKKDMIEKVVTTTQNFKTYFASIISSQGEISLQKQPSQKYLELTTHLTTDQNENERAPNEISVATVGDDHLSNLESRVVGNSGDVVVEHNDTLMQYQEKDAQPSRSDEKEAEQAKVTPCIGVKESQQIDFEQEPLQVTTLTQDPDSLESLHMAVTATMHDDLNKLVVIEQKNILESALPKLVAEESCIPAMQTATVGEETREIDEVVIVDDGSKTKALAGEETSGILAKGIVERENLLQHINAFITDEITEIVNEISNITKIEVLKESISVAEKLRESIIATDCRATAEEASGGSQECGLLEQALFAQILQDSLSTLHTQVLDSAEIITPVLAPNSLQKVSEIISLLQKDLATETVSRPSAICTIHAALDCDLEEYGSMAQLKMLLQDVNSKLILTSNDGSIDFEDSEALKDTLDEVQTVIIKLKRDYDGAVNDTLNETLEDLECSVRSVQLQINEVSPPELLTEACATLQLLVENMNSSQIKISESTLKPHITENILEICSNETEQTVNLIDLAVKLDVPESSHLGNIVSKLKIIKDSLKSLRENFVDVDILIECGVSVIETLEKLEENIFSLDKQVDSAINLPSDVRDNIITAVHSVYGSISNMRSTVSSVQKRYMFENYGKPSQSLLHAIKNITFISSLENEVENQENLNKVSKSIRKVLNHFEDVKFYINLDKTARLPSDAAFTKIILEELKKNIITVLYPRAVLMGSDVLLNVKDTLNCVETNLTKIEPHTSLEVKNKIPMFKVIANKILNTTNLIRNRLQAMPDTEEISINLKNNLKETLDDEGQQSENEVTMQSQEKDSIPTATNISNGNEMLSRATKTIISQVAETLPSPNLLFNTEISLAKAEQSTLLDVHVENSILEPEKTLEKTQNNLQENSVLNIEKEQTDAGVQVIDKVELDHAQIAQIMEDEMSKNLDQAEQLLREEKLTEKIMEDNFGIEEQFLQTTVDIKGDLDEQNHNIEVKGLEIGECSKTLIQLSQVENIVKDDENLSIPVDTEPNQETKEKHEENMLLIEQNTSNQSVNLFQSMSENDLLENETVIKNEEQVKTSEDKTISSQQISSSSEGNVLQFVSKKAEQVSQILEKDNILEIEEINLQKEDDENIKNETELKDNQESPCSKGIENSLKHNEDSVKDKIIPIEKEASSLHDSDEAENINENNELKQEIEITCSQERNETEIKTENAEDQIETELNQTNKTPIFQQETEKIEYVEKANNQEADIEQKIKETCQHIDTKEVDALPGRKHETANKNREPDKEEEKSENLQAKNQYQQESASNEKNAVEYVKEIDEFEEKGVCLQKPKDEKIMVMIVHEALQTEKIENEPQEIEEKQRLQQDEELQTFSTKINETAEEAKKAELTQQEEKTDLQLKKQGNNLSTGDNEFVGKVKEMSALKDEYTDKSKNEKSEREQNVELEALVETTNEGSEKDRNEADHKISKKALIIEREENKTHFNESNKAPKHNKEETELEINKIMTKSKEKHEELSNKECEATKYAKGEPNMQKDKEQKEIDLNKKEQSIASLQEGTDDQEEIIKDKNKHTQNETKEQPALTEEVENLQRATADKKARAEKKKEVENESTIEKEEQEIFYEKEIADKTNSEADSIEMVEKQRIKMEKEEQDELCKRVTASKRVHDKKEEKVGQGIENETLFKMGNKTADKSKEGADQKDDKLEDLLTEKYVIGEIAINKTEEDKKAEKIAELKETEKKSRIQEETEIYDKSEYEKTMTAEKIKEAIELKEKEQYVHLQKEKDALANQENIAIEKLKDAADHKSNETKTKLQQGEQNDKEEKERLQKDKNQKETLAEKQDQIIEKEKVAADLTDKEENARFKEKKDEHEALAEKENETTEKVKEAADELKIQDISRILEDSENHKKIADKKNKAADLKGKEKDENEEFATKQNEVAKNAQEAELLRGKEENARLQDIDNKEDEAKQQNETIEKCKEAVDFKSNETETKLQKEKEEIHDKQAKDASKRVEKTAKLEDKKGKERLQKDKNQKETLAEKQDQIIEKEKVAADLTDKEENARFKEKKDEHEALAEKENKTTEKVKEAADELKRLEISRISEDNESHKKIADKNKKAADLKGKEKDENEEFATKQNEAAQNTQEAEVLRDTEENARLQDIDKKEDEAKQQNETIEKRKETGGFKSNETETILQKEKEEIHDKQAKDASKRAEKTAKLKDKEEKERLQKDKNQKETLAEKQDQIIEKEKVAADLTDKEENARFKEKKDEHEALAEKENETTEKVKEAADELKIQDISRILEDSENHKKIADKKNKAADLKGKEKDENEEFATKQNEVAKNAQEAELLRGKEENARLQDIDNKEDEAKQQNETIEKCKEAVDFKSNETETKLQKEKEEENYNKQAKDASKRAQKLVNEEKEKESLQQDKVEKEVLTEKQNEVNEKAEEAADLNEIKEIARLKGDRDEYEALAEKENEVAQKAKEADDLQDKENDEIEKLAKKENEAAAKNTQEAELLRYKEEKARLQETDNKEDEAKQQNETIKKCKEIVDLKNSETETKLQKEKEEENHNKQAKDASKSAQKLVNEEIEKESLQQDKDEKESVTEIQNEVNEKAEDAADLDEIKEIARLKGDRDEYKAVTQKENDAAENAKESAEQKKEKEKLRFPENIEGQKHITVKNNKATENTKEADDLKGKEKDGNDEFANKVNEAAENTQEAPVLRDKEENTCLRMVEEDNVALTKKKNKATEKPANLKMSNNKTRIQEENEDQRNLFDKKKRAVEKTKGDDLRENKKDNKEEKAEKDVKSAKNDKKAANIEDEVENDRLQKKKDDSEALFKKYSEGDEIPKEAILKGTEDDSRYPKENQDCKRSDIGKKPIIKEVDDLKETEKDARIQKKKDSEEALAKTDIEAVEKAKTGAGVKKQEVQKDKSAELTEKANKDAEEAKNAAELKLKQEHEHKEKNEILIKKTNDAVEEATQAAELIEKIKSVPLQRQKKDKAALVKKEEEGTKEENDPEILHTTVNECVKKSNIKFEENAFLQKENKILDKAIESVEIVVIDAEQKEEEERARLLKEEEQVSLSKMKKEPLRNIKEPDELHEIEKKEHVEYAQKAKNEKATEEVQLQNIEEKERRRKKKEVRVKKGSKDTDKVKNTESIDKNENSNFLNETEENEAVTKTQNEAETVKNAEQKREIILDEITSRQNEKEGKELVTEQTKPSKRDKDEIELEQKQNKDTYSEKEGIELEVNQMDKEEQVRYKKEKTRQRKPDIGVTETLKQENKETEFQVKQKEDHDTTFEKNITSVEYVESDSRQEINIANEKYRKIDLDNFSSKNNYTSRIDIEENKNMYGTFKKENGDASDKRREVSDDEHYIKEYQYVPTHAEPKLEAREKLRFIDHNHRDYTMEFARPTGYRERSFNKDQTQSVPLHDHLGRNTTIYKANTIVLDSQLRSSAPPYPEGTPSRMAEHNEKRVIRHKCKALSEARSTTSEVRTGSSRDSKRKPVFSTYLTDRTAVEGSRVKLTCSVLSSCDPKVTWYKNGVLLDNKLKYRTKLIDGLITLEVLNAVPSDSAEYSCTIENENGAVNSSANLKVYPSFEASPIPPTFTRSIRDTYHLAENELVLECRIRGQPLPTITWLKDDKSISTNSRYQAYYLADGVCRLAIESPTPDDSGKYTCQAENSVWSDQIAHVVNFTGNERRLSPNINTVQKSRFNRQALESRRPHFANVLTDYKVVKGGTIGLQVEIRGAPTRVEWLREGSSVTEVYRHAKTFVEQGLYTLALSDVTEKESGMYTCRAWSTHGNVDMNAAITVVQPSELEGRPATIVGRPEKDILISVGEDVNISFRVQGEPKPKVIFMKGIRDITTSQRVCKMTSDDYVKFTLKRSVIADAGTYCVLVRNTYGCDRAFVTVVVRQRASSDHLVSDWTYAADDSTLSVADRKYKSVPERIPGEPRLLEGGHNWISLGWPKSEPKPSGPVLAYRVESWLIGKEGGARWTELGITPLNSFDVFNLKQGEEFHFRITPRNRYGWGESVQTTSPIGVGVPGERPEFSEFLPGQLKVLLGETARLGCSVKGKPTPDVVWMKNGHEVEDDDSRVSSSFNGFECCLTIKDVASEDEARYSCEATNVHGRASTYARVAVVTDRSIWEADAKLKRERSAGVEGDFPPQFTMRLRDRRVQATYPVRLTCQVIGSPDPGITWFKDGEELVPDSRRSHFQDEHFHTLEIAPTTLDDGGVYEAMARNSSAAVSCRCNLVVDKGIRAYVAPEFCCGLEPLYRLSDGEELRISAVVEAYPSVGVTWYRDGVRLRPSRRAIMTLDRDGQIELAVAAVTPRDAGVYTCTASNEVGRASTSGKVEVSGADVKRPPPMLVSPDVPYSKEPMFIRKPRSSEAREGDTVIIECEVVGDPKPEVYWLRDFLKPDYYRDSCHFKRLGEGPQYRFEIPHAKLDYTGAYSVVARNPHGEAKAVISLQILARDPSSSDDHNVRYGRVEVLARFDKELTDLLSCDGDAVEFECRVSGHPEPDVRWFHYHELIRECSDFETSFEEGAARLKIKQVTAEDEGTYTCEAANSLGKATCSACLVVYPPGEPNTLSQRLRRPPALLSAASTPRSTPRTTPARSVSRTPGPEPRRLCSPARTAAPSFYTYPFNKVAEESDAVTMQCAIKGNPAPWATWDKDGVIITPSARIAIKEKDDVLRVLEIDKVTPEDVGVYRITIENEFGRAEASARLEVITQKGKFYAGVRAVSPGPRRSLAYRSRRPSTPRED